MGLQGLQKNEMVLVKKASNVNTHNDENVIDNPAKSPDLRQSRRYEIMNRSKRIERMNHLKVVIPETYSIDQCADLPFPGS